MRSIQSKITLTYILISLVVTTLLAVLLSVEIENSFAAPMPLSACSLAAAGGHGRAVSRLVAAGAMLTERDAAHYFKTSLERAGHRVSLDHEAWRQDGEMTMRSGNDVWHVDRKMNLPADVTAPVIELLPRGVMPSHVLRPKRPKLFQGKLEPRKREVVHVVEDMTSLTIDWWTFEHAETFTEDATCSTTLPDLDALCFTARVARRFHRDGRLAEDDRAAVLERVIAKGDDAAVASLLEAGAVPDVGSVVLAAEKGHSLIVERLLAAGIRVDAALFERVVAARRDVQASALQPLVAALDRNDPRFKVARAWLSASVPDWPDDAPLDAYTDESGVVDLGA